MNDMSVCHMSSVVLRVVTPSRRNILPPYPKNGDSMLLRNMMVTYKTTIDIFTAVKTSNFIFEPHSRLVGTLAS
jgi:hypothetical protein